MDMLYGLQYHKIWQAIPRSAVQDFAALIVKARYTEALASEALRARLAEDKSAVTESRSWADGRPRCSKYQKYGHITITSE